MISPSNNTRATWNVSRSRRTMRPFRAKSVLIVFAWSGLSYAIFGIVSYLIDPSKMLGIEKDAYQADLTATFYNRNTAAIYFGSCAVVWLIVLLEKIRKTKSLRDPTSGRLRFSGRWLVPSIALLVCLIAALSVAFQ